MRAFAGWAHSASGAFVVVQEPQFVDNAGGSRLWNDRGRWTTEMDEISISLHEPYPITTDSTGVGALTRHSALPAQPGRLTMKSISTSASRARSVTPMQVRAGSASAGK